MSCPIIAGEPYCAIRKSKLDTTTVVARLAASSFPVVCSQDPGRFVCNHVYYNSLHYSSCHSGHVRFCCLHPWFGCC